MTKGDDQVWFAQNYKPGLSHQQAADSPEEAAPYDVEIYMHMFRLMRSGNYFNKEALMTDTREAFPEVSEDRLVACLRRLATALASA